MTDGPLGGRGDPVTDSGKTGAGMAADPEGLGPATRRRGGATASELRVADVVVAGHRGDAATPRRALGSPDPRVREVALGALARTGSLDHSTVEAAIRTDPDPGVRRRACDVAATLSPRRGLEDALCAALDDVDPLVAEAACWALGESYGTTPPRPRTGPGTDAPAASSGSGSGSGSGSESTPSGDMIERLASTARAHADTRAREAAVAALGTIGDPRGLRAVLDALGDRPTVRRRAVVALAAFDGDEVADALQRSTKDRDWQVREVAEILSED